MPKAKVGPGPLRERVLRAVERLGGRGGRVTKRQVASYLLCVTERQVRAVAAEMDRLSRNGELRSVKCQT